MDVHWDTVTIVEIADHHTKKNKEMIEKKTGKNVDKIIKQLEGKNKMSRVNRQYIKHLLKQYKTCQNVIRI